MRKKLLRLRRPQHARLYRLVSWRVGVYFVGSLVSVGGTAESVQDLLQNALLNIVGKPQKELEHVDIGACLEKHGLASLFPEEVSMRTVSVRSTSRCFV